MTESRHVLILSTAGSRDEAVHIARELVRNHLVACVNLIPSIDSIYWWNNGVNEDQEVLMIMKTQRARIQDVENLIRSLHSYQTPELIVLPIEGGLAEYLKWIDASVQKHPN